MMVNEVNGQATLVVPNRATPVAMQRAQVPETPDQALWVVIRNSTEALSFERYADFIEPIMGGSRGQELSAAANASFRTLSKRRGLSFPDTEPYRLLKVATEVFMMANCGVVFAPDAGRDLGESAFDAVDDVGLAEEEQLRLLRYPSAGNLQAQWDAYLKQVDGSATLPYLYDVVRLKLGDVHIVGDAANGARENYGILRRKLTRPTFLELIWNYWHEEGMLVQTMNAISWRFQNRRGPKDRDPLAMLEIDPLRGLNNLLWGWV